MNNVSKTVSIQLLLKMERYEETENFDYTLDVDNDGQIVLHPNSTKVSFIEVNPLAGYDSTEDTVEGNIRSFALSITANMLSSSEDYSWFSEVDEVGQVYVTPYSEESSFENATINGSLNIVEDNEGENNSMINDKTTDQVLEEEAVKDVVAREKEEKEKAEKEQSEQEVKAKVEESIEKVDPRDEEQPYTRSEIERELTSLTNNFTVESDTLKCGFEEEAKESVDILKQHYSTVESELIGGWYHITFSELLNSVDESVEPITESNNSALVTLSDLESQLNDIQATLADLRQQLSQNESLNEAVEEEPVNVEEIDENTLIHRFMTGDVTILPAENVEDSFIEIKGLNYTHGDEKVKYYYNKEADVVAYIIGEGKADEAQ